MVAPIEISGRKVGQGHPCFMIAEVGVNHNGDVNLAKRLIDVAAEAEADAVKFQTFRADSLVNPTAPKAQYQLQTTDATESQLEMLQRLELPPQTYGELQAHCKEQGVLFMSTPFDKESCDLLDAIGIPVFKIGSAEITDLPFLEYVARKGKPIILSTGMSYLSEVDQAVKTIRNAECKQLALLHCVSSYPPKATDVNLRAMQTMHTTFRVPVGYSDHTPGLEVALAAVALGACVIEKHFTLDRGLPGPDHRVSLEPNELAALVQKVRIVEAALGDGCKEPSGNELDIAATVRRSLVAAWDIPAGAKLTEESLAMRRPGTGLPPSTRSHVIGHTARVFIPAGTLLTLEMLA
jgi:N-acetylneuraminate synthase